MSETASRHVPEISVCLTTYQRAHLVGRTIESILAQSFGDFELLIQDNASSDDTQAVCLGYQAKDPRVSYQRNPENFGMPGNLNRAIARAKGRFIANLHDGDHFAPDLLEKWRMALVETGAAFVFNGLEVVDFEGRRIRLHEHPFGRVLPRRALTRYMLGRFDSPVWGTVMARAESYRGPEPFNPRYSYLADTEMWMRLNLDAEVAYIPEPLISITPHEPDRPYAYVNWKLEQALVDMRLAISARLHSQGSEQRAYRARLGKMAAGRWSRLLASCARRGRPEVAAEGMAMMRHSEWGLVRAAGVALGPPAVAVARMRRS